MSDLIDRQAAIDAIETTSFDDYGDYIRARELIEDLPPIEPGRKTGRWIKPTGMMPPEHHGHYECSECGTWAGRSWLRPFRGVELTRYCPGCGAKMTKEEDK